jgi:thioesterase domain-containing protein
VAPPPLLHTVLAAFESLPAADQARVASSIRYVRSGAAALRPALAARLRSNLGAAVLHGYGMTEVGKIACTPLDESAPPGSVGRPLGVELRLDPAALGAGGDPSIGEIVVRGDVVAPGYFDDAHESASAFEGGWFRTGDLGRLDDEGHLYLLGRRDDVVSRGGVLVSLDALEAALETDPAVHMAVAVAVDHPNLGTDIVLAFARRAGATDAAPAALREFLVDALGASHAPTRIVEVDDIPLTSSGKPSRTAIAAILDANPGGLVDASPPSARADEVEARLAAMWVELLLLDRSPAPQDDFFGLGADSLHLVELCALIARELDADLMPGELIGRSSLVDMAALVREGATRTDRPILVPLRAGDPGRVALYLVPGAGGTMASFQRFVAALEPGRPVYGFEALGTYDGEEPLQSVSAMAELYVRELAAHNDGAALGLGGFCFGGLVTQEMTRLLEEEQRPPALLVIFDSTPPSKRGRLRLRISRLKRRLRSMAKAVLRRDAESRAGNREPRVAVLPARTARRQHRVQATSSRTLLLTSSAYQRKVGDSSLGWREHLLGPVEVVGFEGTHLEMLHERARETAGLVDDALASIEAGVTHQTTTRQP